MENNNDALRELFSGLERGVLKPEARENIMDRIHKAELKHKKDNRFEWILFSVFAAILLGGIYAVRYFWFNDWNPVSVKNVTGMIDSISMPSIQMPDIPPVPVEYLKLPPIFIFVAVCMLILLFMDRFMRNRYNKKHSTEM